MERRRQSANANVKLHTWYLSFVPWTSTRTPKEFIFKSLKNSKELLFDSNIQISEISPGVLSNHFLDSSTSIFRARNIKRKLGPFLLNFIDEATTFQFEINHFEIFNHDCHMKNYKKFLLFLNLTQLRCFLLFISKTKLMDEIAEEPHYEFSFFETCQLTWKKEQQEELCCCCC